MGTKIEWTDEPWNPITGCTKVSPGCANCYAEKKAAWLKGMGRPEYQEAVNGTGKWTGKITLVPDRLEKPLHWRKPRMIFVNSMSDLFHENVPAEWVLKIFSTIRKAPHHIFQILTKRPERAAEMWYLWDLPNVWLGVSVENQKTAEERIPVLLKTEAAIRYISAEPLLDRVDLRPWLDRLDWVIAGGESGPNHRPCDPAWVRSLRDQCQVAEVPFFFKQWGGTQKIGDTWGGCILDGRAWQQFPAVLKADEPAPAQLEMAL